ncbi:preprotein translocase subunit SecY [filamentous cyanobacterium LEGE 11480]|uniref:Protein translocase subunit SecY n=1 Tax=Romeriopsis navalis LEGE 11480 TaxID=2777977 RepID=A0A928Z590_9CYAN|nr:preprotein translocase subunit SecY [Romeriopsis navalis]MBE9032569.1 preprotein translocase subunit SecY [Romeriopsis navalis LEGE 11480]
MVNRDKAPSAQETFSQMAKASGLRGRLLTTIGLLVLIRLGIYIPVPGIDRLAFAEAIANNPALSFLDLFSGGGLRSLGIFALGIIPFINASIIIQLLTAAIPSLERLQKEEGEAGRRKIGQITRYVALGWAVVQSTMLTIGLLRPFAQGFGPQFVIETVLALTAGAMFVMWVSELLTERGVGNGASLVIFLNIVATLPQSMGASFEQLQTGNREFVTGFVILLLMFLAIVVGIVFVEEGARRIPIVSARRQVGRNQMSMERTSYLPLKLNQGGVMPIIFASAVLTLPAILQQVFGTNAEVAGALAKFNSSLIARDIFYFILILFFSYFYATLVVQPEDMSKNLKKMGASIPGVRPGNATTAYISKVMNRLTLLGALFLSLVAIVPTAVESATKVTTFRGFGATSLLILVGVAIQTAKQVQTYVISQRYEGMVNK